MSGVKGAIVKDEEAGLPVVNDDREVAAVNFAEAENPEPDIRDTNDLFDSTVTAEDLVVMYH